MEFASLDAMHEALDEQFLRHQECLVERDLPGARRHLRDFAAGMALHLAQEDDWLLPLYAARGGPAPRGGAPEVFRLEHARIRELIDRVVARVERLDAAPGARELIALLERQATLKHVLEHHTERERAILYPRLQEVVPEAERDELVRRCRAQWDERGVAR